MNMTTPAADLRGPFPISTIAGRYLLFDIDVVTYLRRTHHICGVLTGTIPQIPQQNVFLGLPLELLPEEARLLVEKKVCYIVDDKALHLGNLATMPAAEKKLYLESLRSQGRQAQRTAEVKAKQRSEAAFAKQAMKRAAKQPAKPVDSEETDERFFGGDRPASPAPSIAPSTNSLSSSELGYGITPSTSNALFPSSEALSSHIIPTAPSSYPLFKHLHERDYFLSPGLRFGCQYVAYPGDPLRFHSHFLAVSYDWDEEISLLDLIGGGRLGTAVKKGFLVGGQEPGSKEEVRTFCIEWGGM